MKTQSNPESQYIDCDTCQRQLPDYVHLELSDQAAEQIYPLIAAHLETCETCERLYYQEFRHQGRATPLATLKQTHHRAPVATVVDQVVTALSKEEIADENWVQIAFAHGRAWLDKETKQWRRLSLALPTFNLSQPSPAAITGLMGKADQPGTALEGVSHIAPEGANFELRVAVSCDQAADADPVYRVEVAVIFNDRFGDFSGTMVTLLTATHPPWAKQTNALGKVEFSGLQLEQLTSLRLIITLGILADGHSD